MNLLQALQDIKLAKEIVNCESIKMMDRSRMTLAGKEVIVYSIYMIAILPQQEPGAQDIKIVILTPKFNDAGEMLSPGSFLSLTRQQILDGRIDEGSPEPSQINRLSDIAEIGSEDDICIGEPSLAFMVGPVNHM